MLKGASPSNVNLLLSGMSLEVTLTPWNIVGIIISGSGIFVVSPTNKTVESIIVSKTGYSWCVSPKLSIPLTISSSTRRSTLYEKSTTPMSSRFGTHSIEFVFGLKIIPPGGVDSQ